jgi:ribonuclease-3 family protein
MEERQMLGLDSVISEAEARQLNPVVLAFVGDAVYSLYVRKRLALSGGGSAADFQRAASKIVSAEGQSAFLSVIEPLLTETETEIYKRGRNAKKATKSNNASAAAYNRSTGFEAVIGYLHLTGQNSRLDELFSHADDTLFQGIKLATAYKPTH